MAVGVAREASSCSAITFCPLTAPLLAAANLLASDARNKAASAISLGSASRPSEAQ
jgi:hypothetical protein